MGERQPADATERSEREIIEWWAENYWRQIRRLHKAYANLGCVDDNGSAMHYRGEVGPKECTCEFCTTKPGALMPADLSTRKGTGSCPDG